MKLYNLFEEVILESITKDKVIKAIEGKYRVNVMYKGENETVARKRTIDIYAFGIAPNGELILRVFQPFGATTTKNSKWKTFRFDRIDSLTPTNYKFYKPISDYATFLEPFNANGDKSMSSVYNIAKF